MLMTRHLLAYLPLLCLVLLEHTKPHLLGLLWSVQKRPIEPILLLQLELVNVVCSAH